MLDVARAQPELARVPFIPRAGELTRADFAMMEAQLVLASWVHKLRFELSQTDTPAFEPLLTLRPRGGIRMHVVRRHQQQALLPAAAE